MLLEIEVMLLVAVALMKTKKKVATSGGHNLFYHYLRTDYTLISTSTPEGRSSFIRASIVLVVEL